ncbi:MAG: SEA (Seh1-associated) complex subunit [Claussenomyces sp. TS43310]|nr:MAG: SEA (Seh1-associated) complex subunit [Claussenomyces sp. TS43310]
MVQGRIIKRLLGQPANDNNADANLSFESQVDYSFLRPNTSQAAELQLGPPLTCLDKSPRGNFAVVAGEKVFKIVKVDGATITEEHNLRAAISAQSHVHNDTLSAFNDRLNIKTVKWAHGELDTHIITASANGRITLYDVNNMSSGLEVGRIREHARQVHKVAINPIQPKLILSGSQDGTARLFDLRTPAGRGEHVYHSRAIFRCNADAVRDIKWTPAGPESVFHFACSTASGTVQYWDTRKQSAPIMKINAHDSACLSISWHPDGKHLMSGGFDQRCHVWDLSGSAGKRQKPKYSFSTPAPVSIVSWRPACWSSAAKAKRAAQVAVVYDNSNSVKTQVSTVHIWDLARPSLPFKEIAEFDTSPTDLIWYERDLFWTVGKEGAFTQTDVAYAPTVIDRRSLSTFDFSSSGDVLMLLEERRGHRRSVASAPPGTPLHGRNGGSRSPGPGRGPLSLSKSDSDDDAVGSFLGRTTAGAERDVKRHGPRSGNTLSTTPPSVNGTPDKSVMNLDEGVQTTGVYKPTQIMAVGHVPSTVQRGVYQYLSEQYMQRIAQDHREAAMIGSDGPTIVDRITSILDHFAKCAEGVGHFRLGQTWKILAYTMGLLLTRRSQYHREHRLAHVKESKISRENKKPQTLQDPPKVADHLVGEETPKELLRSRSPLEPFLHPNVKSIIAEGLESTSNMTTPLARPVCDSTIVNAKTSDEILSVENDELQLPPAVHSSGVPSIATSPPPSPDAQASSSLEGYDFYDMASITTPAIDIAAPPQKKAPLRLDLPSRQPVESSLSGKLSRRDSLESFQMFSTSGESRAKFPSLSESSGRGSLPVGSQPPVPDVESSWDSSLASDPSRTQYFDSANSNYPADDEMDNLQPIPPRAIRIKEDEGSPTFENGFNDPGILAEMSASVQTLTAAEEESTDIIQSDYLPHPSDPPFMPEPIDPHLLVQRTIQFELQTGCLNSAAMILLLKPLLKPGTLDDVQAAALFRQYHHRLMNMMLFTEAALLRKLCYPTYRSTYSQGLHNMVIGYTCMTCHSPMGVGKVETGVRLDQCRKCKGYLDGCSVCSLHEPPSDNTFETEFSNANLWWWCQGCGHGGHTSCMQAWHSVEDSDLNDGCCPLEGCLHPCLPGKWREEWMTGKKEMRDEEMHRNVKKSTKVIGAGSVSVRRDDREIGESRAVESVRGSLSAGAGLDRKKSVKVVAPGEERAVSRGKNQNGDSRGSNKER